GAGRAADRAGGAVPAGAGDGRRAGPGGADPEPGRPRQGPARRPWADGGGADLPARGAAGYRDPRGGRRPAAGRAALRRAGLLVGGVVANRLAGDRLGGRAGRLAALARDPAPLATAAGA